MPQPSTRPPPLHHEQLRPPWSWWLLAVVVVLSVALAYDAAGGPAWSLPAAMLVTPLLAWWLLGPASLEVTVDTDGLSVGAARLPTWAAGTAVALDEPTTKRLLGRDTDPRAYHATAAHVRTAVRVAVDDPDDPVPYWVVSTRDAAGLVAALEVGRGVRPRSPGR